MTALETFNFPKSIKSLHFFQKIFVYLNV